MKKSMSLKGIAVSLILGLRLLPAAELHVPAEYATIQAAIEAAASGDIVRIAAGDYYEQIVVVDKRNIILAGEPGTAIHAFSGMIESLRPYGWLWYPVVAIFRSEVVLSGLTINGDRLGELYSGSTRLRGIYFLGSSGTVTNCTVRGFRASTVTTASDANGMHVFNPVQIGSPPVNIAVFDSTFIDNEVAFILRGDPGANPALLRTTVSVKGNTITGLGTAPIWNVGVWIVCGVTGDVTGNTVSDFAGSVFDNPGIAAYDAAAGSTHGRFVPLQPLSFEANTLTNNGQHLLIIGGNGSKVVNNKFLGNISDARTREALRVSGTNVVVSNNDFLDSPTGILLVGNETWGPPWPPPPPAANPRLTANWFCNVPGPIRVDPTLVSGVEEHGSETCANGPFRPVFQSISKSAAVTVRSWHGQRLVLEASTNLQHWAPIHTNLMTLPTLEYQDASAAGLPQRFYRALAP